MGFEVEIGPQEISTQSGGKNIHHGSGVCVVGKFFVKGIFFLRRAFLATYVAFAATRSTSLMKVWGICT